VTARFLRRDARVREDAQRFFGLVLRDEVELHVLARRDVTAFTGGEFLRDIGEREKLCRRRDATGQLRAHHHHAFLPLAIDAVEQAERPPLVGRQLAALERFETLNEQIDVLVTSKAESTERNMCWGFRDTHEILAASWLVLA
jgi:hypothetical protein